MIELFCFVLAVLSSPFKSKLRLEAENAVLRHQLIVLTRRLHGRVRLTNNDRWFLIQLYRLSLLLALEVAPTGRATADRHGAARIDPADERRKSALGRATHPRRTAQARPCRRSIKRRQIHGQTTGAAQP